MPRYRIHPAIGIARVGNAPPDDFFLGPELPGRNSRLDTDTGTAVPPFKSGGLIKRQAARFRIWEYVETDGVWSPHREVSLLDDDVAGLSWTTHLANRKASFFEFAGLTGSPLRPEPNIKRRNPGAGCILDIDPLPRTIAGRSAEPVELSRGTSATPELESWPPFSETSAITSLGQLRTDDAGRLIVIPASGATATLEGAPSVKNYANNDGWFDDVADGPVDASITMRQPDGTLVQHDVAGAWLLVGPPDFAPPLPQVVSLYDLLFDLAVRHLPIPDDESQYQTGELARLSALARDLHPPGDTDVPVQQLSTYRVDFDADVAPVLRAAAAASAVFNPAHDGQPHLGGTGFDAEQWALLADPAQPPRVRPIIFAKLRRPSGFGPPATSWPDTKMPRLLGDDPNNAGAPNAARGLTVTPTQYVLLKAWQDKAVGFTASRHGPDALYEPPSAATITPHGLDRAALENASGGAFFPGIEVSWLIRDPSLYAEPFRIRHGAPSPYRGPGEERVAVGAGFFSRQLAVPWLADFRLCQAQPADTTSENQPSADEMWGWWPSQRPDHVLTQNGEPARWSRASGPNARWAGGTHLPDDEELAEHWWEFGFVYAVADADSHDWRQFCERERSDTHR